MTHFLTDPQYEALQALCETLIPTLEAPAGASAELAAYYRRSAKDLEIAREVTKAIRDYASPESQAQTKQFLDLLASPMGTLALSGRLGKFADLPSEVREKILLGWSTSPVGLLRQGFQGIKRLTHSLYFSILDQKGGNPNWAAIAYPGPPAIPETTPASRLPVRTITEDTTLECDVVVVGSGAGGGVVAGVLAKAGQRVIVLEKGGYPREQDYAGRELEAFRAMYENAGVLTSEDLGVVVLAGATLGGGTTINWAASFRTPDYVLEEWERDYHLTGFTGPEFQAALDAVCARAHVDTDESAFNAQNQALHDGCEALGYHTAVIPRNVKGCGECGWCCFGCAQGAKQSTLKTWLQDAVEAGAEVVVGCQAERVLIENGQAVGVQASTGPSTGLRQAQATVSGTGGSTLQSASSARVTIRAKKVVVAAGALHSPALLLRSGIENPNIGLNLRLHPTTAVRGELAGKAEPWRGVMMGAYSDEWGNLDGQHYGVKLETPPAHPGLLGFALPWLGGRVYKEMMLKMARQAIFIVLCRDRGSGRITVDKRGRPRIHYQLAQRDAEHLQQGIEGGLRVAVAAGASEVGTLQAGLPHFKVTDNPRDFEAYVDRVWQAGTRANQLGLFSAHQMGTCRMGGERNRSVVNHLGESWDVRGLYVADASTFPTPSGVNPMMTIEAVAYTVAQGMLR